MTTQRRSFRLVSLVSLLCFLAAAAAAHEHGSSSTWPPRGGWFGRKSRADNNNRKKHQAIDKRDSPSRDEAPPLMDDDSDGDDNSRKAPKADSRNRPTTTATTKKVVKKKVKKMKKAKTSKRTTSDQKENDDDDSPAEKEAPERKQTKKTKKKKKRRWRNRGADSDDDDDAKEEQKIEAAPTSPPEPAKKLVRKTATVKKRKKKKRSIKGSSSSDEHTTTDRDETTPVGKPLEVVVNEDDAGSSQKVAKKKKKRRRPVKGESLLPTTTTTIHEEEKVEDSIQEEDDNEKPSIDEAASSVVKKMAASKGAKKKKKRKLKAPEIETVAKQPAVVKKVKKTKKKKKQQKGPPSGAVAEPDLIANPVTTESTELSVDPMAIVAPVEGKIVEPPKPDLATEVTTESTELSVEPMAAIAPVEEEIASPEREVTTSITTESTELLVEPMAEPVATSTAMDGTATDETEEVDSSTDDQETVAEEEGDAAEETIDEAVAGGEDQESDTSLPEEDQEVLKEEDKEVLNEESLEIEEYVLPDEKVGDESNDEVEGDAENSVDTVVPDDDVISSDGAEKETEESIPTTAADDVVTNDEILETPSPLGVLAGADESTGVDVNDDDSLDALIDGLIDDEGTGNVESTEKNDEAASTGVKEEEVIVAPVATSASTDEDTDSDEESSDEDTDSDEESSDEDTDSDEESSDEDTDSDEESSDETVEAGQSTSEAAINVGNDSDELVAPVPTSSSPIENTDVESDDTSDEDETSDSSDSDSSDSSDEDIAAASSESSVAEDEGSTKSSQGSAEESNDEGEAVAEAEKTKVTEKPIAIDEDATKSSEEEITVTGAEVKPAESVIEPAKDNESLDGASPPSNAEEPIVCKGDAASQDAPSDSVQTENVKDATADSTIETPTTTMSGESPSVAEASTITESDKTSSVPAPRPVKTDIQSLTTCEDHSSDLTVSVVSWNLAEEVVPEEDSTFMRKFRKTPSCKEGEEAGSDIVLISSQECENIKPRRMEGHRSRELRRLMIKMLGKQYVPLAIHSLGGIQFGLFCKRSILNDVEFVSVSDVTCGIGNMFHNKGAIAAFLQMKTRDRTSETSDDKSSKSRARAKSIKMMFVTAHLAAHVKNVDARNADYWRIASELEAQAPSRFLTPRPPTDDDDESGGGSYLMDSVDRIFFCGDLNYRVDLPREIAEHSIAAMKDLQESSPTESSSKQLEKLRQELLLHDQLRSVLAKGTAFPGFAEGKITFMPTFKFDKDTKDYDTSKKQRIPAWTDRVLFKPQGTRVLEYKSEDECTHSDHRPVHATFRVSMQGKELPKTRPKKSKSRRPRAGKPTSKRPKGPSSE